MHDYTVTVRFKTGNAAFGSDNAFDLEVARVLQQAADHVNGIRASDKLIDTNGNTVGTVTVEGRDDG